MGEVCVYFSYDLRPRFWPLPQERAVGQPDKDHGSWEGKKASKRLDGVTPHICCPTALLRKIATSRQTCLLEWEELMERQAHSLLNTTALPPTAREPWLPLLCKMLKVYMNQESKVGENNKRAVCRVATWPVLNLSFLPFGQML